MMHYLVEQLPEQREILIVHVKLVDYPKIDMPLNGFCEISILLKNLPVQIRRMQQLLQVTRYFFVQLIVSGLHRIYELF